MGEPQKGSTKVAGPCSARGAKAARMGFLVSFVSSDGLNRDSFTLPRSRPQDPFASQRSLYFLACLQSSKTRKLAPEAFQKQSKSFPKSMENDFRGKSIFAILSMRKTRFGSPKRRNFDAIIDKKMTWIQARTKKQDFKLLGFKKLIYTGPKISPKSCKLPSRVHPAAPMVLQGGPKMPKWLPRLRPRR